jgi:iron(III) transport system permease protein
MLSAIWNTITLTATRQAISFAIGIVLAWVIARTDLPGRAWLEFGFWIAFFLPALTVLLGWILLLDSHRGMLNKALLALPFVKTAPFEIFSWWGIIWVHLVTTLIPIKVMLFTPAFRNMDASLEEASMASGATTLGTFVRIVVPVLAPTIMVVMVLGLIKSIESFEIELILGSKDHIDVYSTLIYREAMESPPRYGSATALSMVVLLPLLGLVGLQQWLTHRRSHTTVTGKYNSRVRPLGRWRWPTFAIIASMLAVMTVVPIALVVLSTFMTLFGFFEIAEPWTLRHWQATLTNTNFVSALRNTLIVAGATAGLTIVLCTLIAYISVKTRFALRGALDFLTWLPSAIPGVVASLGLLWMFLATPVFRPLYGTTFILIIALTLVGMTLGVQLVKTNLVQLGTELEEASWACGAPRVYTFVRVVLPLIAPCLAVVGVLAFAGAARAVSLVSLLSSQSNRPLALLQLDFMSDGTFERASVVGVIILLLTVGVALVARVFGLRVGPST